MTMTAEAAMPCYTHKQKSPEGQRAADLCVLAGALPPRASSSTCGRSTRNRAGSAPHTSQRPRRLTCASAISLRTNRRRGKFVHYLVQCSSVPRPRGGRSAARKPLDNRGLTGPHAVTLCEYRFGIPPVSNGVAMALHLHASYVCVSLESVVDF